VFKFKNIKTLTVYYLCMLSSLFYPLTIFLFQLNEENKINLNPDVNILFFLFIQLSHLLGFLPQLVLTIIGCKLTQKNECFFYLSLVASCFFIDIKTRCFYFIWKELLFNWFSYFTHFFRNLFQST
jgi:hypothetical protein